MTKFYSLLLIFILLFIGCRDQQDEKPANTVVRPPVDVSTQVDKAVATTGDEITYTVIVNYDPAATVDVPEIGVEIGGFRVLDLGENGPRKVEERLVLEKWYTLKADLVGSYILPPVTVPYEYEGKQNEASTAQIFVEVESVLNKDGASEDIRDIKPLVAIERDMRRLMIIGGLCALTVLCCLAGLVIYVKKQKARERVAPARPAHEIALEQLRALQEKNLVDTGNIRLYYFELSEIFREYLENRFSFFAVEQTTEEIVREMEREDRLDEHHRDAARHFLKNTDWVKFAKHNPGPEEIERDYGDAVRFVQETKEM